ncbi:MAG: VCBS repeat-containing protein, partial [Gemmatimonadota bacterium]|nr:VCBS repeat-containing protein [Gemmatimonadota bacterium]
GFPFLGGFNVPRPQLIDVDADGDDDLFVQEETDRLMLFESVGERAGEVRFELVTDRYRGLEIGEWYRFADVDGDGDPDLLGESKHSLIRVWENVGTAGDFAFEVWADTLRDASGEAIFSDRQNIPNALDLDCDGRLDLMIGRLDGTVSRYEATEPSQEGVPRFELVDDTFEDIRIVAQITPSARHGANTLVFHDADGDGDPDLFWGDFFEPGLLLIENRGSCENPSFRGEPRPWPPGDPVVTSGYNAPTFGDLDGDGALDAVIGVLGGAYTAISTAADNLYRLERGSDGWTRLTRRLLAQVDVGAESVPAVGDLDGDGDPDLLLANKIEPSNPRVARIYRFENVGAPDRPELRKRSALPIEGAFHWAPALADLDADADLDLALGTWNDGVLLYENVGTATAPEWEAGDAPLVELTRGSHATPAFADLDGDGDLDLVAGESSGEVNLWRNEGSASKPLFVLVSDTLNGIDVGRRSHPALADLDGDGAVDLLVAGESGEATIHRGTGELGFERDPWKRFALPGIAAPVFADLDGDGAPELLVGEISGGLRYYDRAGP